MLQTLHALPVLCHSIWPTLSASSGLHHTICQKPWQTCHYSHLPSFHRGHTKPCCGPSPVCWGIINTPFFALKTSVIYAVFLSSGLQQPWHHRLYEQLFGAKKNMRGKMGTNCGRSRIWDCARVRSAHDLDPHADCQSHVQHNPYGNAGMRNSTINPSKSNYNGYINPSIMTIWRFPKLGGTPKIIHFDRMFHYESSV